MCGAGAFGRSPVFFFQSQRQTLFLQSAGITRKCSVGADDAVAGNDDGDGISVICHTHGAAGLFFADGFGDVSIAAHLAVRDVDERRPNRFLKNCAFGRQRQVKALAPSFEIFRDLSFRFQHLL